jgi:hypothetical protein
MSDSLTDPVTFIWMPAGGTVRTTEISVAKVVEHGLPAFIEQVTIADEQPPPDADEAWFLDYLARHSHRYRQDEEKRYER